MGLFPNTGRLQTYLSQKGIQEQFGSIRTSKDTSAIINRYYAGYRKSTLIILKDYKMPKQQLNLRVSDLTTHQIKQLIEWWGTSKTETITLIIDRIYKEEHSKWPTKTSAKDNDKQRYSNNE